MVVVPLPRQCGERPTRFGSLGSNRYDFWRVSLDLAKTHPLVGVGAGNFGEEYLKHRRTSEQPTYSHSIEMTLLSETGGIGAAIFLFFFGAAALAVAGRKTSGDGRGVGRGRNHDGVRLLDPSRSVDWLWQFPLLGLSAFLLLGLAIAPYEAALPRKRLQLTVAVAVAIVGLSFLAPWIAARQVAQASHEWRQDPAAAYAALHQASRINPLSDEAAVVAGTIAAERKDAARMRMSFQLAVSRDPGNWFSRTQLAVALANEQAWAAARRSAQAAVRLDPREQVAQTVLDAVRSRKTLELDVVNKGVFSELQALPGLVH